MQNLCLTIACSAHYDHVRHFASGTIRAEGIDARFLHLRYEDMVHRFLKFREFEVSEMSLGKYVSLRAMGDRSLVAIPVFPSRLFRISAFYVRADSPLTKFEDLKGKKVGVPEWAQSAAVWARGYLSHETGVPLSSIKWFQAGVDEAGRTEKVQLTLPSGIDLTPVHDKTLRDMLLNGEIDAIITAIPPAGETRIRPLIDDCAPLEESYFRKTGIFPIMHTIVVRGHIAESHPWVLMNLFKAFEEAKRRSVERMRSALDCDYPVPWLSRHIERTRSLFEGDYWPYGVEGNRKTLAAFLQYAFEQGVCQRLMTPDELFPENVRSSARI